MSCHGCRRTSSSSHGCRRASSRCLGCRHTSSCCLGCHHHLLLAFHSLLVAAPPLLRSLVGTAEPSVKSPGPNNPANVGTGRLSWNFRCFSAWSKRRHQHSVHCPHWELQHRCGSEHAQQQKLQTSSAKYRERCDHMCPGCCARHNVFVRAGRPP